MKVEPSLDEMSLRDLLAIFAMQGLLSSPHATQDWIAKSVATSAYQVADNVFEERAKGMDFDTDEMRARAKRNYAEGLQTNKEVNKK